MARLKEMINLQAFPVLNVLKSFFVQFSLSLVEFTIFAYVWVHLFHNFCVSNRKIWRNSTWNTEVVRLEINFLGVVHTVNPIYNILLFLTIFILRLKYTVVTNYLTPLHSDVIYGLPLDKTKTFVDSDFSIQLSKMFLFF